LKIQIRPIFTGHLVNIVEFVNPGPNSWVPTVRQLSHVQNDSDAIYTVHD
jgi:hypothetical protein